MQEARSSAVRLLLLSCCVCAAAGYPFRTPLDLDVTPRVTVLSSGKQRHEHADGLVLKSVCFWTFFCAHMSKFLKFYPKNFFFVKFLRMTHNSISTAVLYIQTRRYLQSERNSLFCSIAAAFFLFILSQFSLFSLVTLLNLVYVHSSLPLVILTPASSVNHDFVF